jgi:hypothetical protein
MKSERGSKIDSRFVYNEPPKWRQGQKQFLWGTEYITIGPTTKTDTLYEFELPTGSTLLFGNQSGFYVKGFFQYKAAGAADSTYATIPTSQSADFALIPNWFEHMLKDPQLYHGNTLINPHDVPRYSDAYLNAYLYAHMYPETKKCLLPEPHNPGHSVGIDANSISLTETESTWQKYAAKLLGSRKTEFRYIPLHAFPFMQQTNFCTDGRPPAAVPLQVLQKMTIQLQIKEDYSFIFMKKTDNTKEYRFKIESIQLIVEEARINPAMEKSYLSQKGPIYYSGLTKFAMAENINASVQQHKLRFQDVPMPEGLFIFALPKTALSGTYDNSSIDTAGAVFKEHNITELYLHFNNMPLSIKSPHIGEIGIRPIELKQLMDHYEHPPFGVLQDPALIKFEKIKEGGKDSAFPHIYIPLCPSGKETRIVPVGADGQVVNKNGDLDITLKFGTGGAKDNTYIAYIFYTDVNMQLDLSTQTFTPVYKRSKTN